jgi:hypothetical protein
MWKLLLLAISVFADFEAGNVVVLHVASEEFDGRIGTVTGSVTDSRGDLRHSVLVLMIDQGMVFRSITVLPAKLELWDDGFGAGIVQRAEFAANAQYVEFSVLRKWVDKFIEEVLHQSTVFSDEEAGLIDYKTRLFGIYIYNHGGVKCLQVANEYYPRFADLFSRNWEGISGYRFDGGMVKRVFLKKHH